MLNEEKRNAIVAYRLERSQKTLEEIPILIRNELLNTAISRLYYAYFYAVSALLIKSEIDIHSHSGARKMLSFHFVKTKKLSVNWK